MRTHADAGARYYQPWRRLLTPALQQKASQLGLRTSVFYANHADDMNAIWNMGFQGILTDRCDLAHEVRCQRTGAPPATGA
ncbi:MAG: hypothetical protein GX595_00580 [Lentisphaerae bacterium]|nr:hypothetical protein [Lentisphaerota bacterium]